MQMKRFSSITKPLNQSLRPSRRQLPVVHAEVALKMVKINCIVVKFWHCTFLMFTRTQMFNFQQRADYFSPHIWIVCLHFWVQFASFFVYKLLEGGQLSASPLMIKVRISVLGSRQRCKVSDLKRNLFLFMVELRGAGFSDNLEHSLFLVVSSLPGRLLRSWRQSLKWSSMSGPGPGCRVGSSILTSILRRSTHSVEKVSK